MHGRIKTRSTEEQARIKKQEKEKKVVTYKNSMNLLKEMRDSKSYEKKALDITTSLLLQNPDILTAWNYRREIVCHMKEIMETNEFLKLIENDLTLTEQCLRINPKSYGSWHYRVWALMNSPEVNWKRELGLCKRYLELDERNFHCWDYRRFIAQMANEADLSEYDFTLEKIKANFSNYSAWHLRSKLLPKIFPDHAGNLPISEEKFKEELDLVQNAAFTDPNDQSAWFYQRWLLGLTEPKTHIVCIVVEKNEIYVALSKSINQNTDSCCGPFIKAKVNDKEINELWKSSSNEPCSAVWILHLDFELTESDNVIIYVEENGIHDEIIHLKNQLYIQKEPKFMATYSLSLKEVLTDVLSRCEELLELEPDSKWTIFTRLLLMQIIDSVHYEKQIETEFMRLISIDPLRCNYYQDSLSKYLIEKAVEQYYKTVNNWNLKKPEFILTGLNITCLYHMQYFVLLENINLSNNSLTSESLRGLHCLVNCKMLNLDNNKITSLKFLPVLPKLIHLSVCNNNLLKEPDTEDLSLFSNLKQIYF